MARWTGQPQLPVILGAAENWKGNCLFSDGSVFTDEHLWTTENLAWLRRSVVDNPLLGSESFYSKLEKQLTEAPSEVVHLAAEVLWFLLLFSHESHFSAAAKRARISTIWQLSGSTIPTNELLDDKVLSGVATAGTAFNTMLHAELSYALHVFLAFKGHAANERATLLSNDGVWEFCRFVTSTEGGDVRSFRHMLLFLCFPDSFERCSSRNHKRRIYETFKGRLSNSENAYAGDRTPCGLDRTLLAIRGKLAAEFNTDDLDFYVPPLRPLWYPDKKSAQTSAASADDEQPMEPHVWIEKTNVRGRVDRSEGPHRLGEALWSPQRAKDNRDVYANMRKVRDGDIVLHLTDRVGITGVSIAAGGADDTFTGVPGTQWGEQPSYRIQLREFAILDPPLGRDALFNEEPTRSYLLALADDSPRAGLFYNRSLELGEGGYLTAAPPALIGILQHAYQRIAGKPLPRVPVGTAPTAQDVAGDSAPPPTFTIEDALQDLFLERALAEEILAVWKQRKNVILQGPPGVGKSYSARLLAYALSGVSDPQRVDFIQFHQSYAYEDFVQGYRPSGSGFELRLGRFANFCERARLHGKDEPFVFIVDEINRGNVSKILGELMLLIEPDKRSPKWAVQLAYSRQADKPFYVPENVYVMGLMNTADRSLAVVDYALRRRFAFYDLGPRIDSQAFSDFFAGAGGSIDVLALIRERVGALNAFIASDEANLGRGFEIGHSFFCPDNGTTVDTRWYARIVESQVLPLLREYWFDSTDRVGEWREKLLRGL